MPRDRRSTMRFSMLRPWRRGACWPLFDPGCVKTRKGGTRMGIVFLHLLKLERSREHSPHHCRARRKMVLRTRKGPAFIHGQDPLQTKTVPITGDGRGGGGTKVPAASGDRGPS